MVKKQGVVTHGKTKRILNCIPSRNTEKDWHFEHASEAGLLAAAPAVIPKSKDLREPWWTIGDQKETGSCVGWGTAEGVLRWHFVKAHRLANDKPLSVRYIWMAAKETDEYITYPNTFIEGSDGGGTSLKAALDVARKFGVVEESVLPFEPPVLYPGSLGSFYALAARLKISSYINLRPNPDSEDWNAVLKNLQTWIATKGPILTALDCDDTWMNAKQTNGKLAAYDENNTYGGHCVVLVGYTPDSFIVRNSWGTEEWGDEGFAYASLEYTRLAFTETYGVNII